jgi:hypothetical protein
LQNRVVELLKSRLAGMGSNSAARATLPDGDAAVPETKRRQFTATSRKAQ